MTVILTYHLFDVAPKHDIKKMTEFQKVGKEFSFNYQNPLGTNLNSNNSFSKAVEICTRLDDKNYITDYNALRI